MFCRQCEQTVGGKGCSAHGVCGKSPEVSSLQDLLVYALKGIAVYGQKASEFGIKDKETGRFIIEALFTTVTNVNFDPERIQDYILKAYELKEHLKELFLDAYSKKHGEEFNEILPSATDWAPANNIEGLIDQAQTIGILADPGLNEDIRSLRELLLYGLKGMAAYAD
ncbi:MAG: hydroxylamine reductase, partial [Candidatus Omnitrophica bacterium]|nr:hydroxylamine reductase [Candidatus Omnitrophota bacterium]